MKRKQLLTKTLLVVAMLCVGANIASAEDGYAIVWQDLFDNASTYSSGWTLKGSRNNGWTYTQAQKVRSGEQMYYSISNVGYNTMATYTLSGITAFASATDYIFEMDYAMTLCNTGGTTSMIIYDASETPNELFKVALAGKDNGKGSTTLEQGNIYINGNSTAETTTMTMNTHRGGTLTWYHIKIVSNSTDGTKLTLTKCDDATETNTFTISSDFVKLGKIYQDNCGANATYYGAGSFDNFVLQTPEDATSVAEPTMTITDFDGTSRTIQLSTLTDGATIYYSETNIAKDAEGWTQYENQFSTTTTPIYAYAKKGDYTSDIAELATGAGTAFVLNTPTCRRTGANTYTITASATTALGFTADQTIHYTINGGEEQTSSSPASLINVDGNIVAWATADKFGNSANLEVTYVPAIATGDTYWSYNLNSYSQSHSCTAIANALDTENGVEINGTTLYNLKEENYPDLFIENSTGWLLRNQTNNAWKCQSAASIIAFNNVSTSDVIHIYVSNDNSSTNSISSVTNGTVVYNYSLNDFFITPTTDGAVSITLKTGTSLNTVEVYKTTVSATIASSGYTSLSSAYALNFSGVEGLTAFVVTKATSDGVTLSSVEEAPAETGLILKGTAGEPYSIPVVASAEPPATNLLSAVLEDKTVENDEAYILKGGKFCLLTGATDEDARTIPAGKAYLPKSNVTTGKANLTFAMDEEVTGVANVNANENRSVNGFYNLAGQRVSQPVKGLYIKDGKKYVVK